MPSSPLFLDPVVVPLVVGESVLDVGCGAGRWGMLIRSNHWEAGLAAPPVIDGFDAWSVAVEASRALGIYRTVWEHVLPAPIEGRWDTVLACEVIEHLPPRDVDAALRGLEAAARQRLIVTTPNWEYLRGGHETFLGYSDFEAHLSFIPQAELRARGFTILGAGLGMNSRSRAARALRRLRIIGLLAGVPSRFPRCGDLTVAYKDVA